MSKPKVPLRSEFVSELVDLIWPQYVLPVLQEGCPDVVATEHQGDVALHREEFADGLDLYKSLGTSMQRVRYKMAWCQYRLGQPDSAVQLLQDAEKADGTFPIALLCYSLQDVDHAQNRFTSSEARERIVALVRIALNRPDPVAGIYYLADQYLYGADERSAHVKAAYQQYPHVAQFRRAVTVQIISHVRLSAPNPKNCYVRSILLGRVVYQAQLVAIVHESIMQPLERFASHCKE
jgi:hypothetical protein